MGNLNDIGALGVAFDVPIPLPLFGHRLRLLVDEAPVPYELRLEHRTSDAQTPRGPSPVIQGPGHAYATYDRFGRYSYSFIQMLFLVPPRHAFRLGLFADLPQEFSYPINASMVSIGPAARPLMTRAFNELIDSYSLVNQVYWLPRVTPRDLANVQVLGFVDGEPHIISAAFGDREDTLRFGLPDNFRPERPQRLKSVVAAMPLELWEEVWLQGRRALSTQHWRSAVMHASLAFEMFITALLQANQDAVPDKAFSRRTLKQLCERKTCLPALIGEPLDSGKRGTSADDYLRIAAVRDQVLHRGLLCGTWRRKGGPMMNWSLETPPSVAAHVESIALQIRTVNQQAVSAGHNGVVRFSLD